jgi:uncharacterized membrane protein YfcA
MLAVTLAAAVLVGVTLSVLGGGGSILTVPLLVYAAGVEPKAAIAMSLFVVGVTSTAGLLTHARAGRVRWRTGLLFGAAGMAGAYAGGRVAAYIPATWLLAGFGVMMLATAAAMIRGRRGSASGTPVPARLPAARVVAEGLVVGAVTGLVGAGGGFLVVPALALLAGLPMAVAVGTSLLVIVLKSFAGLAGYLSVVDIDWRLTLAVTAAAAAGSLAGGPLAGRIPETVLRKGFGWFVIVMGAFVLAQQVPADILHRLAGHPFTWAVLAAAIMNRAAVACRDRLPRRATAAG